MQQRTRDLLTALERADWFAAVGQPVSGPFRDEVLVVSSWFEAVECCGSTSWENLTLERQNSLTSYLHEHARDRYRRWNEIVGEKKEEFEPVVERKPGPVAEQHGLPEVVGHCVRWDILGACMEGEYADVRPTGFFTELMGWYVRGRFPCGWVEFDGDCRIRLIEMVPDGRPDDPDPIAHAINFPWLEPPIR